MTVRHRAGRLPCDGNHPGPVAQIAHRPPATGSLRARTQPSFRQWCNVAAGIPRCRASSPNNHSPRFSSPATRSPYASPAFAYLRAKKPDTIPPVNRLTRFGG